MVVSAGNISRRKIVDSSPTRAARWCSIRTQHGCHTFMISMASGLLGLALAAPRRSKVVA